MIRAVVDTNIFVSGLLTTGTSKIVVDKGLNRAFTLLISGPLRKETSLTLKKFVKKGLLSKSDVNKFLWELVSRSELVIRNVPLKVCRDPKDNMILETALCGKADFIVTGDKDLLVLNPYEGIPIITPKKFLEILKTKLDSPRPEGHGPFSGERAKRVEP